MKNTSRRTKNNAGMALLTALMFISITVLVLTSMTARYVQQRIQTDRFEDQYLCFEAVEAALEQGKTAINKGNYTFRVGIPTDWKPELLESGGLALPEFEIGGAAPGSFTSMPDVEYVMYVHQWDNDGYDTNGDGVVDSDDEAGMFSVHAAARMNGLTRRLEAVYDTRNFGIWNNAIFAGRGQAGRLINGNVRIHGSVHLLGDDLPEGAPAVTAIDLSGSSMILNDYTDIDPILAARVPAQKLVDYNGDTVTTLDAEARVRNGVFALSGAASVGRDYVSGSGYKGPVDGTYVTDGWGGNQGDANVWSDNGSDEVYDLGNSIALPGFEDNWRDPDTGDFVHNPNTGTWYTHAEYFTQILVGGPNRTPAGGTFHGDVVIDANKGGFYYNATTGEYKTGVAANAVVPNPDDHFILKKTTSTIVQINGAIHIDGNLTFTGKANDDTLNYVGRAAFMAEGAVRMDCNLLSGNSPNNVNDFAGSFPYNSCLGIMSRGRIDVGTTSQLNLMGAFYSADCVASTMQTMTMGTFVGRDFEMGKQVPDIYQVPVLAQNLPLGMIGDYPIIRVRIVSWREIGVGT
jgi:hypothetical protein